MCMCVCMCECMCDDGDDDDGGILTVDERSAPLAAETSQHRMKEVKHGTTERKQQKSEPGAVKLVGSREHA